MLKMIRIPKKVRFSKEREHLISTYSLDTSLVDDVINNITSGHNYFENDMIEVGERPDFFYESEILNQFKEFKQELIYDGFYDFSEIIKLNHFYRLFSPSYNPNF